MPDVQVVNPLGRVGVVPQEQLEGALAEGYTVATPEQVRRAALEERFGGTADKVAAGLLGAAHGATAGLSTAALAGAGDDSTRATLKGLRDVQSGAFIGGEVVGSVIGAGKVGAPANLAARAGKAVAGKVASKTASKALQYGAQAATEGALYGVGEGLAQAAIDNKLNGEKFAATVLGSTIAGGVLGGGIGAGAGAFGRARQALARKLHQPGTAALQRVGQGAFGEAVAPSFGRKVGNLLGDGAALLGKPREAARSLLALDKEGAALRRAALEGTERKAAAVDDIAKLIDGIEDSWDRVVDPIRSSPLKRSKIANVIKREHEAAQAAAFQQQTGHLAQQLDGMLAAKDKFTQGGLKDIRAAVQEFTEAMNSKAGKGTKDLAEHLYSSLDQIKREVGKHTQSAQRSLARKSTLKNIRRFEAFRDMYDGLREGLEDVGLWGGAAEMQRSINKPLSSLLGVQGAYRQRFLSRYGRSKSNPWRDAYVADRHKIARHVNELLDPNKDLTHRALTESLAHRRDAARAILEHGDLDAASRAAVEGIERSSSDVLNRLDVASKDISAANQLASLEGGEGALGGLIGGAVGSGNLAALAMAPLVNPARAVRALAAVEGMAGKLNLRLDSGVKGVLSAAKNTVPAAKAAARAIAGSVPRGGAAAARGGQRYLDSRERFEKQSAKVRELAERGPALQQELQQELSLLSNRAPTVHAQALAVQQRALDYLTKHMPGAATPHPFGIAPSVSRSDAEQWLRRARAVEDPISLLDDMAKGTLSRDAVEAVQEVYPELFSEIQAKVLEQVAELDAQGKRPPYEKRKQLGVLLDIQTDVTLDPGLIAQMQAGYAQQGQQQGPGKPRGQSPQNLKPLSAAFKTDGQELEETRL